MRIQLAKEEVAAVVATHLKSQFGVEAEADEIMFTDSYRREFATWESKEDIIEGVTDGE